MNILAICSALDKSYAAFKYDDKIFSKIIKSDKNYHSLYLNNEIQEVSRRNSISLKKLNLIIVNCGPGSFTGIRVALSIAKVFACELNLPLVGLNTAEILLNAYNKDILLMDARRDMYYLGTKEDIKLISKEQLNYFIQNKSMVCDLRTFDKYPGSTCYETSEVDLGKVMLKIGEEKYLNSKNKDDFNYLNIYANYIQTPPV